MVDGRLRHDWRQHLWRIVYLRPWMGGEHGHDLPANVCRLFLWLPRCGLRVAPTLLPAETHQHLFLSGKPLRTAHSPHWRFLLHSQQTHWSSSPSLFGVPRSATVHHPHAQRLSARLHPTGSRRADTHLALHTPQRSLLHRAHRCPANALPPVGSRWHALHGGKHAPSRFL